MKSIFTLGLLTTALISSAQTGKIGIGTTNPQAQLHTTGSVRFDTLKGSGGMVYVTDSGTLYTSSFNRNLFYNETTVDLPSDINCTAVTSSIIVTGRPNAVPSRNVRVKINVVHTRVQELDLCLITPSGQVLILVTRNGGIGSGFANVIFADGAPSVPSINTRTPITGTYKPTGGSFSGCSNTVGSINTFGAIGSGSVIPNGTWTLKATDAIFGDDGILVNWSISFDGIEPGKGNMTAVAYGNVFSNATESIVNSSGNCTLKHNATGVYQITFTDSNLSNIDPSALAVNTSLFGDVPGFITFTGDPGRLIIKTFNLVGQPTDRGFGFSVFKP